MSKIFKIFRILSGLCHNISIKINFTFDTFKIFVMFQYNLQKIELKGDVFVQNCTYDDEKAAHPWKNIRRACVVATVVKVVASPDATLS